MSNGLQGTVAGRGPAKVNSANAVAAGNPPSPHNSSIGTRPGSARKRTIDSAFGEQSPESVEGWDERDESRIGVKRACNECRQQKLRCDVVQDPWVPCSRCRRCSLDCRIDSNFKRVGKRKRNAEMEREIVELRNQLASQQASPSSNSGSGQISGLGVASFGQSIPQMASPLDQYMGSHEAVTSLLDLKSGVDGFMRSPGGKPAKRIEDVILTPQQVQELFDVFFTYYNPFQPLLEPGRSSDHYYDACPLLFWAVIAVAARHYSTLPSILRSLSGAVSRLLWATVADVPQSYYVVKALCILCIWPLPISSTSADPTFMIAGLVMQISMQIGLHRPSHAQDFSKFKVELRDEELRDRVKTWAACNVVAQRVATGYGQPASTAYDWTLAPTGMKESGYKLPDEMDARLRIEIFCDKVTRSLYNNSTDPVGLASEKEKSVLVNLLVRDWEELEQAAKSDTPSINYLYIQAANLHLRLSVFFDSPSTKTYQEDLMNLWFATINFLEQAFDLSTPAGHIIKYATNYLLQMIIAAGFSLLKLLNSFFAQHIDLEYGRNLFARTIRTIRAISVIQNDLTSRLAEVLAQLWRAGGAGMKSSEEWTGAINDSLQLKVRCRMSMSLVYDSVWRWREEFQAKGRGNLESALNNPTNPDSSVTPVSTSGSTTATTSLAADGPQALGKALDTVLAPPSSTMSRAVTPGGDYGFGEWNNEVFDPLTWMLDGLVGLPYGFGDGMEAATQGVGM